jgi:ribosomal protein L17
VLRYELAPPYETSHPLACTPQRELTAEKAQCKLVAQELADLLQEGRDWKLQREHMSKLVSDAAAEVTKHRIAEKRLDRERRVLLKQFETISEEFTTREARMTRLLSEEQERKMKELEGLRDEMNARMKMLQNASNDGIRIMNGEQLLRLTRGIVQRWLQLVLGKVVGRWYGYAVMERVLIDAGNLADKEAWLRNGRPQGWARRDMQSDRRVKGGTPLGYTTSLALAVPSAAKRLKEGVNDGFLHLEAAGPAHALEQSPASRRKTHSRPKTAGAQRNSMKLHHSHSDALRERVRERREFTAQGIPTERPKSAVVKMRRPQSAAESHLKMVCLRTLADIDEPTIDSAWNAMKSPF